MNSREFYMLSSSTIDPSRNYRKRD